MSSENCIIKANCVSKRYRRFERPEDRLKELLSWRRRRYSTEFWALKNVSLEAYSGETVGIVGRNGSGKSTLLKMICGTIQPTHGNIAVRGRISALLELGAGFNNEFTGRENIKLNASLLGLSPGEISDRMDAILSFADIGSYIDQPVKYYSSGMFARLAFAVAVNVDPQILIIDEILAVGDASFQRKCIERIFQIKQSGCTILFVSHDAYQVKTICDRALYLNKGEPVGFGPAKDIIDLYTYDIERADTFLASLPIETNPATQLQDKSPVGNAEPADSTGLALDQRDTSSIDDENAAPPPFEIVSVEMAADGMPSPIQIESGARVEFTVRYRALRKDYPRLGSFVFNLKRHDDLYVCGATTLMEKLPPSELHEFGEFRLTFPQLNLLAGRYKIRFAINDTFGWGVFAERADACVFQVKDNYASHGLVDLPREWMSSEVREVA